MVLIALVTAALVPVPTASSTTAQPVHATVAPRVGGRHHRFRATITARQASGAGHNYIASARLVTGATGCVENRDRVFPAAPVGHRVHADLDPARGDGGPEGWCPGHYAGTVSYGTRVVARFSFRVSR